MVEYLAQDILIPKTKRELQDALDLSSDQAFRILWNLNDRGWVEDHAQGYRLSPHIVQIADRLRQAVADTLHRYIPEGKE